MGNDGDTMVSLVCSGRRRGHRKVVRCGRMLQRMLQRRPGPSSVPTSATLFPTTTPACTHPRPGRFALPARRLAHLLASSVRSILTGPARAASLVGAPGGAQRHRQRGRRGRWRVGRVLRGAFGRVLVSPFARRHGFELGFVLVRSSWVDGPGSVQMPCEVCVRPPSMRARSSVRIRRASPALASRRVANLEPARQGGLGKQRRCLAGLCLDRTASKPAPPDAWRPCGRAGGALAR